MCAEGSASRLNETPLSALLHVSENEVMSVESHAEVVYIDLAELQEASCLAICRLHGSCI